MSAPGVPDHRRASHTERVQNRRHEVGERVGVILLALDRRGFPEAWSVEREGTQSVAGREKRADFAEDEACAIRQADPVPAQDEVCAGLTPSAEKQPRVLASDPELVQPS